MNFAAMSRQADLTMLYYDVGQISKFGAWGPREYGGQTNAPKQVAVNAFLNQRRSGRSSLTRCPCFAPKAI
ncbi:hypothetical protein ABIC16_002282 [Sphingomonas sp. PvP055]